MEGRKIIIPQEMKNHKKREAVWKILVEQTIKRNVIPVIGPEMAKIDNLPSSRFLLESIAKNEFGIEDELQSFTSLVNHRNYDPDESIHLLVNALIESNPDLFRPTAILESFLSIKYFPFVITTTIDPIVENTMMKIHGGKLRVLSFNNNPGTNQDIRSSADLTEPTLYYMFGKANDTDGSFVLTDNDLLRFSRSWLMPTDSGNKTKPFNLSNALSNKYLLVLGNNFQDWLFRFFWFAMKDEKLAVKNITPNGMEASEHNDERLIEFLNYSNITSQVTNLHEFVNELKERLGTYENNTDTNSYFSAPKLNADVFISYSRADKEIADKLYRALIEKGLSVWYDRESLGMGVNFRNEIREAIRSCKLFVPILSHNLIEQADKEHLYRMEWKWAIEHKELISPAINYIAPVSESGFDIEDRVAGIPYEIHCHNALNFNTSSSLNEDLDNIAENLKQMLTK